MEKLDYKKEYKELYQPGKDPVILEIPELIFIMIEGKGNPNTSEEYAQALEILYALSYGIKMSKMGQSKPAGYFEYVVPPLEGFWWTEEEGFDGVSIVDKEKFCWNAMIRQPEFVTEQRRTKSESLRTVIRHPIRKREEKI